MRPIQRLQLHLVTAPRLNQSALLSAIAAAAENGVDWVQIRDHTATSRELFALACAVVRICRPRGVLVSVNDRIDVALAAAVDGIQLGAQSLPISAARQIAPSLRLGASVHDLARASQAETDGADWLTFGHVFQTPSHPDEPPRGLTNLARVVRATHLPVIAIGGIGPSEVSAVRETGAGGIAVISAILNARDPIRATAELRQQLDEPPRR